MPIYQVYLVLYAQTTGSISLRSVFILRKPGDDGGRGAKFFQHRPTIVARWSHCASSYVYSVMIDWTSGGVARSTSISWYRPRLLAFCFRFVTSGQFVNTRIRRVSNAIQLVHFCQQTLESHNYTETVTFCLQSTLVCYHSATCPPSGSVLAPPHLGGEGRSLR